MNLSDHAIHFTVQEPTTWTTTIHIDGVPVAATVDDEAGGWWHVVFMDPATKRQQGKWVTLSPQQQVGRYQQA